MLVRRSGFLSPTLPARHPIINALIRLSIAMMPFALEYLEHYVARERHRRAQRSEASASMSRALTVSEARDILGVSPTMEGANVIPFKKGTEARNVAEKNFRKFISLCQPEPKSEQQQTTTSTTTGDAPPEGKSERQAANAVRSDYLAGKLSGAYRLLVDEKWDRR